MNQNGVEAARIKAIKALIASPTARRELLWLRAKEKEDDVSIESLERADRDLPRRMASIEAELSHVGVGADADRGCREAYGRLYDRHFEQLMRAFMGRGEDGPLTSDMRAPPSRDE